MDAVPFMPYSSNSLLSHEVTDFEGITSICDIRVDGKVSIHKSHFVLELPHHSRKHILNMGAQSTDASAHLGSGEPHIDSDLLAIVDELNINWQVFEGTVQFAMLALDGDLAGLDSHLH